MSNKKYTRPKPASKPLKNESIQNKTHANKFLLPQSLDKYKWSWLGGFMLLAFILRVSGAGRFSFWFDEFLHVLPAADFIQGKGLNHIDGFNGVFTTWVQIVSLAIFGVSETTARVTMAVFSTVSLIPLYFLAKRLFDAKIALTAVFLFAISLYAIFWGRTVRNYATFLPFYLCIHYFVLDFYDRNISNKNHFKILPDLHFNWKLTGLIVLSLIFSLLNHQLTVFIFFGWVFYGSVLWIGNLFEKDKKIINRYILFVPFLFSFGLLFTNSGNVFAKKIFSLVLPPNIVNAVVPDLSRILVLWKEKKTESFDLYFGIIETDGYYLYVIAAIGLITAFIKYRRSALYLFSHFVFLFLLFSFVFREPAVTRYLYFILPFYFIAAAYGIWWILEFVLFKFLKNTDFIQKYSALFLVFIVGMLIMKPQNTKAFLSRTEHGQLIDKKQAEWYYTNWREATDYVKLNMVEGDVILSTVPNAARFYMEVDTAKLGWFRQMILDPVNKQYVQNEPTGKKVSGYTTEEFIATVQNHPRGWLLADYYFNNVMTDPNARNYAIQNLDFHFGASKDGSVQVFSWDHSKRKPFPSSLLIELGKPLGGQVSQELEFNFRPTPGINQFSLYLILEGYDTDGEGFVNLNGRGWTPIPKPANSRGWGAEQTMVTFDASMFNEGPNKAQFTYNPEIGAADVRKGFVIYSVNVGR
jgi:4-amino-4-deoxy-L-arabinose transferase-like glycosyltransferase